MLLRGFSRLARAQPRLASAGLFFDLPGVTEQLLRDMRIDTFDLRLSSVVVSSPPRSVLRLLALGQGSVEIDEKSDEDVSAMVLRPGVGGANMRAQRYPLRLVRAGKLELECSV